MIAEIRLLRLTGYQQTGNWNLAQICEHLSGTMNGGMDGFGFRSPWILRATVFQWAFNSTLKKRRMGSGFPTLKRLKPKQSDSRDNDDVINQCIETCQRASDYDQPIRDYPFLNEPPVDDWRQFMWLHAGHHLSFLVPNDES